MKRRLRTVPRWLLLATTVFSLGAATAPLPASAAPGTPTVRATLHVSTSARLGTCTATVTVRWSNFTNATDEFARLSGIGGVYSDKHETVATSHGNFKKTWTATYDASATDNVYGTAGVFQSPDWVTDDSITDSVPCIDNWS